MKGLFDALFQRAGYTPAEQLMDRSANGRSKGKGFRGTERNTGKPIDDPVFLGRVSTVDLFCDLVENICRLSRDARQSDGGHVCLLTTAKQPGDGAWPPEADRRADALRDLLAELMLAGLVPGKLLFQPIFKLFAELVDDIILDLRGISVAANFLRALVQIASKLTVILDRLRHHRCRGLDNPFDSGARTALGNKRALTGQRVLRALDALFLRLDASRSGGICPKQTPFGQFVADQSSRVVPENPIKSGLRLFGTVSLEVFQTLPGCFLDVLRDLELRLAACQFLFRGGHALFRREDAPQIAKDTLLVIGQRVLVFRLFFGSKRGEIGFGIINGKVREVEFGLRPPVGAHIGPGDILDLVEEKFSALLGWGRQKGFQIWIVCLGIGVKVACLMFAPPLIFFRAPVDEATEGLATGVDVLIEAATRLFHVSRLERSTQAHALPLVAGIKSQ